jgi:hypothetical protein
MDSLGMLMNEAIVLGNFWDSAMDVKKQKRNDISRPP